MRSSRRRRSPKSATKGTPVATRVWRWRDRAVSATRRSVSLSSCIGCTTEPVRSSDSAGKGSCGTKFWGRSSVASSNSARRVNTFTLSSSGITRATTLDARATMLRSSGDTTTTPEVGSRRLRKSENMDACGKNRVYAEVSHAAETSTARCYRHASSMKPPTHPPRNTLLRDDNRDSAPITSPGCKSTFFVRPNKSLHSGSTGDDTETLRR